ncbi:hypothetical protein [Deinococcus sp.]|uniref:hypothetical protein n=1 Tax=Deinococcus sp. TaxID=47478 RepID=UPI003B5B8211
MRALRFLLRLLLVLLAIGLAAAALGAFASLNPAAPIWMRTLSALESLALGHDLTAYPRGLIEAGLSALAVFLAALPSTPRVPQFNIDQHYPDQHRPDQHRPDQHRPS